MDWFKGSFVTSPEALTHKLQRIKAYIFDWDGVFTNGHKLQDGTSSFNETDSMGINLLRFSHYLKHQQAAPVAIMTGENNKTAFHFAQREHFDAVYYKVKHKETALLHFCKQYTLQPKEVLFVFDDVLDFSAAKLAGVGIMVSHACNPLLIEYAVRHKLTDYLTAQNGATGAVREASELVMHLNQQFDSAIEHRAAFSSDYATFITNRNDTPTLFYTIQNDTITEQPPL